MARPYWTGSLQISLVSFGVSLFLATEARKAITFHQISRKTGERIRHQKVLESIAEAGEAAAAVEKDEIVKGYEYRQGQYVLVEDDELERLRVPSKHTIAVSEFIDLTELRPEFTEKPYYVVPENDIHAESFNVVRQALLNSGKAAIGKVAFAGRENIIAVVPTGSDGRGMLAYTLRYPNELRNQDEYFRDIKQPAINAEALQLAEILISRMSKELDLSKFEDAYEVAVKALVTAKVNNLPIPIDAAPTRQPGKIVSLADALRRSIGEDPKAMKKPAKRETIVVEKAKGTIRLPGRTTLKRKSA